VKTAETILSENDTRKKVIDAANNCGLIKHIGRRDKEFVWRGPGVGGQYIQFEDGSRIYLSSFDDCYGATPTAFPRA
jgi:hypothetical protein